MARKNKNTRRITRELETIRVMIWIACRGRHGSSDQLCDECDELWKYVQDRIERCPFKDNKPTCTNCRVHCYKPEMREKIRGVMRYAGPRMPLRHPIMTLLHGIHGLKTTV